MSNQSSLDIPQIMIKVAGAALTPSVYQRLTSVEVDDSLYLPSMATLEFDDPPESGTSPPAPLTNAATFNVGGDLEVSAKVGTATSVIFKGEITSIEPDYTMEGYTRLIVRAYDKGHRLIRVTKTRTFLQVTDSDVISQIANEAGLQPTVDSTSVVHDYLLQHNQTNYAFIQERAERAGLVVRTSMGKLSAKKLSTFASGSAVATVTFGVELLEFRPRLSGVFQPDSYLVQGWDPASKAVFSGTASSATPTASIGASRGASLAGPFGASGEYGVVDVPVAQASEAQAIADARMSEARNGDIQAEGAIEGMPSVMAGTKVTVAGVGTKFNGNYLITRARHTYTLNEGYRVHFESTNGTGETTADLVETQGSQPERVFGAVIGVVTDINDSEGNMGRVKVKLPWMIKNSGTEIESWWARIATPMAGNGRGFMFLPEVNDEVLVAFEHGDVRRPYVIGFLWNGQDATPLGTSAAQDNGKVKQRVIKSTSGHIITIDDSDDASKISIVDSGGKSFLLIDTKNKKVSIESEGEVLIKAAQKIDITGDAAINVTGKSDITVKSDTNVKIEASAGLELKASSGIKMDGGAQVEIKGGMVKIN